MGADHGEKPTCESRAAPDWRLSNCVQFGRQSAPGPSGEIAAISPGKSRSCPPGLFWRVSAIGARHPEDIAGAVLVRRARGHEEPVREAVEIADGLAVHLLGPGKLDRQPFGPAADRTAEMEMRRQRAAPRKHEAPERFQMPVHGVDLGFEPEHLRLDDAKRRVFGLFIRRHVRPAEIGAKIEEIILNAGKRLVEIARSVEARKADGRIGLVHRAIGRDPQRMFRDPDTVAKRGLAPIAGARIDTVQDNHFRSASLVTRPCHSRTPQTADMANMTRSTMAASWAAMRSCIIWFCRLDDIMPVPKPPIPVTSTASVRRQAAAAR